MEKIPERETVNTFQSVQEINFLFHLLCTCNLFADEILPEEGVLPHPALTEIKVWQ